MSFLNFIKKLLPGGQNNQASQSVAAEAPPASQGLFRSLRTSPDATTPIKRGAPIHVALRRTWTYRAEMEMKELRMAIESAENPYRPRRFYLLRLYHEVTRDLHLAAQLRISRITVERAPFQVVRKRSTTAVDEAAEVFEQPWFNKYLRHALDAEFYGHSLLEFRKEADMLAVYLVPREHVRPESGEIVLDIHHETGLPFRDGPLAGQLIEVGEADDLGILLLASREAIRKKYSKTDWSRKSEKFGMPFVVLKTASQQETEIDKKSRMLENMGSNNWGVFDDEDELQFHESKSGENGHNLFADLIKVCDDEISKLINGQTGSSDQKAYVGSAEVHERLLNDFTFARLRRLQEEINYKLIPWLIRNGHAQLDGLEFQFTELIPKPPMTDTEGEDGQENAPKAKQQPAQKKKPLNNSVAGQPNALLAAWYQAHMLEQEEQSDCC
jgi:Protein of unknown function (DUF935)